MEVKETNLRPIDVQAIAKLLWQKRKFMAKVCGAFFIVSSIYLFSVPRGYVASVMLAPETSNTSGISGSLSSLASIAGVKIDGETDDAIYPMIYPDIVSSNQFLVDLFKVGVKTADGKIDTDLYTYLTKHQRVAWWNKVLLPAKNFIKSLKSDTSGPMDEGVITPFWLSRKNSEICRFISSSITCRVDKKTDVITLTFTAQDPLVAATMVDSIRVHLQEYITAYRTNKARNDLEYAQKLFEESSISYEKAKQKYATYCDAHMNAILQSFISEQESLENDLQMAYNEYTQVSQQVQVAKAKVQERTPAFTIVQCASVPQKPSSPKRMLGILASLILGFVSASAVVLFKNELKA